MKVLRAVLISLFIFSTANVLAANKSSVLDQLDSLYKNMSRAQIIVRAKEVDDPLQFLRSFVPYYYNEVKSLLPDEYKAFDELGKYEGWCIGDAHLENFGSLITANGKSIFTVNDLDDASTCMLAADFIRFMVSIRLAELDVDMDEIIDAYREGLENGTDLESEEALRLIQKSKDNQFQVDKKDLSESGLKIARKDSMRPVTKAKQVSIVGESERILGKQIKVLDVVRVIHNDGGSGGLDRFLTLIDTGNGTPILFEFKEIADPGTLPLSGAKSLLSPKTRIERTLKLEHGGIPHPYYSYAKVDDCDMLFRPKTKGQRSVDISEIEEDDLLPFLRDEARIIGQLHRSAAQNPIAYRNAVRDLKNKHWKEPARDIEDLMRSAYKSMKSEL